MSDPALVYCVGATKAGTSWFYRTLHAHPECHLRAVKEAHYWDSFDPVELGLQLGTLHARVAEYSAGLEKARDAGIGWQVANMERRVRDNNALIAMLSGDRTGHRAYLDWLTDGAGDARLVADMTPAYAVQPESTFRAMAALPRTLFVYLIRDPLARLWSHVRMQAIRQRLPHEEVAEKANNILWRVVKADQEQHITVRGDYAGTVEKLRHAVPDGRLRVEYAERLFSDAGQRDMATFLGLTFHPADGAAKEHEGPAMAMRDKLVPIAIRHLKDQYTWAAREVGPLPPAWQASLEREAA